MIDIRKMRNIKTTSKRVPLGVKGSLGSRRFVLSKQKDNDSSFQVHADKNSSEYSNKFLLEKKT